MQKVLAVDDSEPMRKMVEIVLRAGGYEVEFAADGAEGLEVFGRSAVDLVITDINMPVMDGIEFITRLRAINTEIPILALTTESEEVMRKRGREAGANGWVVKPFKPVQFLGLIRELLA